MKVATVRVGVRADSTPEACMFVPKSLKRDLFLTDGSTGEAARFSIIVDTRHRQAGDDAAADATQREAEAVIDSAQFIFERLLASGALTTRQR